jgi:hypothetical protein
MYLRDVVLGTVSNRKIRLANMGAASTNQIEERFSVYIGGYYKLEKRKEEEEEEANYNMATLKTNSSSKYTKRDGRIELTNITIVTQYTTTISATISTERWTKHIHDTIIFRIFCT